MIKAHLDEISIARGVLQAISDELHRAEMKGYNITRRGDYAWERLTDALQGSGVFTDEHAAELDRLLPQPERE